MFLRTLGAQAVWEVLHHLALSRKIFLPEVRGRQAKVVCLGTCLGLHLVLIIDIKLLSINFSSLSGHLVTTEPINTSLMANTLLKFGLPLAILAFLYQAILKDLIFVTLAVGRTIQPIADFPYTCRRIEDERLQACEDMWLSDATRQLFLACSTSASRAQWMPNVAKFNHTGRSRSDAVIALDLDKPTTRNGQQSFEYRVLKTFGYPSYAYDDATMQVVGLTGIDSPNQIELLFNNNKPSRDAVTGEILDNVAYGANSTIERFVTGPGATQMKHVKTYSHPGIATPNNIATTAGMRGFYITNDHGQHKTGLMHTLSDLIGLADVTYCDSSSAELKCTKVVGRFSFANGLLFHPEHNLLYVPSTGRGNIHVYMPVYTPGSTTPSLKKVKVIHLPYPLDNLSLDPYTGDMYVAALPKLSESLRSIENPFDDPPPATAFRIRLVHGVGKSKYEVEKVLEDVGGAGSPLPATTTVLRDGKTGRLFLSGKCLVPRFMVFSVIVLELFCNCAIPRWYLLTYDTT